MRAHTVHSCDARPAPVEAQRDGHDVYTAGLVGVASRANGQAVNLDFVPFTFLYVTLFCTRVGMWTVCVACVPALTQIRLLTI